MIEDRIGGNQAGGPARPYHPYRATASAAPAPAECPEARQALRWAIAALFCFGFVLGPIALRAAQAARLSMAEDPNLSGIDLVDVASKIARIAMVLHLVITLVALCGGWFALPGPGFACR